jgi:hypothetical protein
MVRKLLFLSPILFFFILLGCDNSVDNSNTGTLSIKLTDAPFPIDLVSEANVTINMIEVRKDQSESEGNPFLVLSEDEFSYNLLELQNGITADLVEIEVPVGAYNLVRLYVSKADIILKDEKVYNLKVPSGDETGIKIFVEPSITVVGGLTTELILDFDVGQSFVVQGDPFTPSGINGFIFTPVIRAANVSTSGSIEGTVLDDEPKALENAEVWIEIDGKICSSFTNKEGYYKFSNIPAGTYTVNATKNSATPYETVSIEDVEVIAGNMTQIDDIILIQ